MATMQLIVHYETHQEGVVYEDDGRLTFDAPFKAQDDDSSMELRLEFEGNEDSNFFVTISGVDDIDALRRYCEMVLAHNEKRFAVERAQIRGA